MIKIWRLFNGSVINAVAPKLCGKSYKKLAEVYTGSDIESTAWAKTHLVPRQQVKIKKIVFIKYIGNKKQM